MRVTASAVYVDCYPLDRHRWRPKLQGPNGLRMHSTSCSDQWEGCQTLHCDRPCAFSRGIQIIDSRHTWRQVRIIANICTFLYLFDDQFLFRNDPLSDPGFYGRSILKVESLQISSECHCQSLTVKKSACERVANKKVDNFKTFGFFASCKVVCCKMPSSLLVPLLDDESTAESLCSCSSQAAVQIIAGMPHGMLPTCMHCTLT